MSETAINNQAVRALLDINLCLADLMCWIEAAPYLMTDEDAAEDVGLAILHKLRVVRTLTLRHTSALAQAAGVPSREVAAALEASVQASGLGIVDRGPSKVGAE